MFRPSDKLKCWVIKLAAMKLLSGSNVKAPSPSLVVLGAGQPVAGRRRGGVGALVADRELARRHPLVELVGPRHLRLQLGPDLAVHAVRLYGVDGLSGSMDQKG